MPGSSRRLISPKGCKTNALFPRLIARVEAEVENELEFEEEDKEILLVNIVDFLVSEEVKRLLMCCCCSCISELFQNV